MLKLSRFRAFKAALAGLALAFGLGMALDAADARPGKGFSFGSRGSKTYSTPPPTATAPGAAAPMQKSITPNQPSAAQAARPNIGAAQAATPRSNMFRNLFLGGLIGAGLATLFGAGAFASVLGFVLQTLLIGGLIYMAIAFFRNRRMAAAGGSPNPGASSYGAANSYAANQRTSAEQARYATAAAGGVSAANAANAPAGATLQPTGADFDAFERLLGEIQTAYGEGDRKALESRLTPEMLSYFVEELTDYERRGLQNKVAGVKLLQGDLAEAWTEGNMDYATVAMRYSITDFTIERKTGRIVDGSTAPGEATELWTFVRRKGSGPSGWELSAIQQT